MEISFPIQLTEFLDVNFFLFAVPPWFGHFPVVRWLPIANSYLKHHRDKFKWGDWIAERVEKLLKDYSPKKDDAIL